MRTQTQEDTDTRAQTQDGCEDIATEAASDRKSAPQKGVERSRDLLGRGVEQSVQHSLEQEQ
jgi:hypothetical protein